MSFLKAKLCCFAIIFVLGDLCAEDLNDFFSKTESFQRAHVGICIKDAETEELIYARSSNQYFTPASLQKIPLGAAAVYFLGDDYHFSTLLQYDGKISSDGVLHGDVWIEGGADPSLSLTVFPRWEEALRKRGILKVDGKIKVDVSAFESALASPYWYFEDLGNYYGAGASGLSINENLYRVTFKPGEKEGERAEVLKIDPEIPNLIIHNEVTTGPIGSGDRVNVFGSEYSSVQFYRGTVPIDQPTFTIKAAIPDPALFAGQILAAALHSQRDVEVIREKGTRDAKKTKIDSVDSLPLKELMKKMNRESNNLYAEHFCKAIGNGSSEIGLAKIEAFLKERGIAARVRDGSGLARSNMLTPEGFTHLLCMIRKSPLYESLYNSFLAFENQPMLLSFPHLKGANLRAKTGTMSEIACLAGYFTLPSGKEYAFSIFCNHYDGKSRDVKMEICSFLEQLIINLKENHN